MESQIAGSGWENQEGSSGPTINEPITPIHIPTSVAHDQNTSELRTTYLLIGNEEEGMVFAMDETLIEIDEEAPNQSIVARSEAIHAVENINQASEGDEGNLES